MIDEIESSLHPRVQRRLVRELAERCYEREFQVIMTTHSPYVLEELPSEARIYILETDQTRQIIPGVSPQFAMTRMDDEAHPECDLYVEDEGARILIGEILAYHAKSLFPRCAIIPYGAASVGLALGQMAANGRFPRPSCVFLDGDNAPAVGCALLPGDDAPERVVFAKLAKENWRHLWTRIGRDISDVIDACSVAMTLSNHHEWVPNAANRLMVGGNNLWQSMCAEWVASDLNKEEAKKVVQPIEDSLARL